MEAELRSERDALRRENIELRREVDRLTALVSELKGGLGELETPAPDYDRLTGLARRELLADRLDHCILRSERTAEQFAVLYCDLDGFKLVNDVFGHEAGDAVLAEVAVRLRSHVRPYDAVARFGGDEFVILLENIQQSSDALAIAQRMVVSMTQPVALRHAEATVGISIGVAVSGTDTTAESMLARADAAMYEAKHAGKGRVELFGSDLDLRLTDRRELGIDLRFAVARDELELWYRPVASLETGRMLMRDQGARRILSILDAAGADARSVGIEVGEDAVVHDFDDTVAALRELHEGHVCVALDNFCGRLTVPQLHTLRPDTVKLDRSFLTQLGADFESANAIRSITGMIRPLGVTIVAKGVNTQEQLAVIISLNCHAAQGAITGHAARAADVEFKQCVFRPEYST